MEKKIMKTKIKLYLMILVVEGFILYAWLNIKKVLIGLTMILI